MNIDELTLGQIKQLQGLLSISGGAQAQAQHPALGKKVIIRTYSAGVHYGTLVSKNKMEVILEGAIRIYRWEGAFTLSQMCMEGVTKPGECTFAMPVNEVTLEAIEILPCTDAAITSIESVKCETV